MSNDSTFTVTVDGKSISIPLVEAQALCPVEVQAMEEAGEKVSKAAERGDSQAMATATKELHQRMEALLHKLEETAHQQQNHSPANTREYREIVALVSEQPIDRQKLLELDSFLRDRNIEYYSFDLDWHCIQECQRLIRSQGASHVLSLVRLQEAVIPKADTSNEKVFDLLVGILRHKLEDLSPSQSLILIDNYLFTPNIQDKQGYLQMFKDIFEPVVSSIEEVRFVISPNHCDNLLYQDTAQLLRRLNPKLRVECRITKDFHDRFWIADETRGLFIGTSLNGIGKRYALVDYMSDEDTKTIVAELRKLDLL